MARDVAFAAVLALLLVCAAEARTSSRRLNGGYSNSGSSPDTSSPYPSGSSPSGSSPDTSSSSPYSKSPSGSSPDVSTPSPDTSGSPYGSSPSGSSPDVSTPSPDTSGSPYGSSPSGSSPDVSTPSPDTSGSPYGSSPSGSSPDVSTPSPDTSGSPYGSSPGTDTPVTSTPSGGYGGYGKHSGCGTPKFWTGNAGRIPKLLSLVSSLGKLFGPRLVGLIGHKTMLSAIKDESPEAFPSLAREGATSLINAYAYKDFPLSASEVVTQFNNALDSTELARDQALKFQRLNHAL